MITKFLGHYVYICRRVSVLQLFKKEEQNFVFANEIDNMALIMPSQDKHSGAIVPAVEEGKSEQPKAKSKKRAPKKMEITASLNVACLKRLLPIGLNMFGGREQELIQQAKQKLVDVSHAASLIFPQASLIFLKQPMNIQ